MPLPLPPAPIFAALGDETRLALLHRLQHGDQPLSSLAEGLGMSRQAVTKHLDVLERAGLVVGERRGRQHLYRLRPAGLRAVADWVDQYRRSWEETLDRLGDYLQTLPPKDTPP